MQSAFNQPTEVYTKLHNFVSARCGEGKETSPEALGLQARDFAFDRVLVLDNIVYSLSSTTGEFSLEYVTTF